MEPFFTGNSSQKIFLYNNDNCIYLRTTSGADISRAILLCNDFADSLSGVIYHNSIHYTYQNLQGDLIIRNIMNPHILWKLSAEETPDCLAPKLYVFGDHLLLLYFMKNPLDNTLFFRMIAPLVQKEILCDTIIFSTPPVIQTVDLSGSFLITCKDHETFSAYLLDRSLHLTPYESDSKKTDTLKQSISSLQKTIQEKDRIITSITEQYNDLMETAVKYKEEAAKWYNKYYSRK